MLGTDDRGLVRSVSRAGRLLLAFEVGESHLSLAELARRTGMHKPTVLRLARTLEESQFLLQREDGAWRLGPSAGLLGARYQAQFDVNDVIEPILQQLCAETGESASFYVFEGHARSCLMRCEGPRGIKKHVRSGELLPLDRGSAGLAILAAMGRPGAAFDKIRQQGFSVTRGQRSPSAASISAPVHGARGVVLGSVGVSGPIERLTWALLKAKAPHVTRAAGRISYALNAMTPTSLRSTWHP